MRSHRSAWSPLCVCFPCLLKPVINALFLGCSDFRRESGTTTAARERILARFIPVSCKTRQSCASWGLILHTCFWIRLFISWCFLSCFQTQRKSCSLEPICWIPLGCERIRVIVLLEGVWLWRACVRPHMLRGFPPRLKDRLRFNGLTLFENLIQIRSHLLRLCRPPRSSCGTPSTFPSAINTPRMCVKTYAKNQPNLLTDGL